MTSIQAKQFVSACSRRYSAVAVALLAFQFSFLGPAQAQVSSGGGGGAAPAAVAPGVITNTQAPAQTQAGTNAGNANAAQTSNQGTNSNNAIDNNAQGSKQTNTAVVPQQAQSEFQQMVQATTGRSLPIFGSALFGGVPSTFAPVTDVPIGPGYILGPGDRIDVQMAGQVNQQLQFTVDRTGAIAIPGIGAVQIAGTTFADLPRLLSQQLSKLYRNFTLNVNLSSLRTIQIFITGNAVRPGTYTISSLSTLTNAIFASGGPSVHGTMRDIQVKRGGQTIDHFDLYDLLLHGDKSKDISLATGDVIFIPDVGPQIALVGSVNNPAIYELLGKTSATDAIQLAGGFTPVAADSGIRLERVDEHSERSIQDVLLAKGSQELLRNGDIISVTSVLDRFKNAVTLRGNVANPGRYVWHPGMRISDLMPNKESLITRDYWTRHNQLGQPGVPAPQGEGALQVRENAVDRLAVDSQVGGQSRANAGGDAGGSSVGVALTANSAPFAAKTDVVLSAPDIYWDYAVIERQNAKDLTTSLIPFNLGSIVLEGKPDQNYELLPGDIITIFSKADLNVPSAKQTKYVRLEGEFNAVGVYSVLPGETLRGLLRRVGGFTPDAYLYASEFTRESARRVERQRLTQYADQLEAQIEAVTASDQARALSASDQVAATASEGDARAAVNRLRQVQPIGRIVLDLKPDSAGIDAIPDIALEDGDRFVVPRIPANVTVEGQVYNANAFLYSSHQRVIDYLKRAGGPDREADKHRIFVLRADGSVTSHQYSDVERSTIYPGDTVVVPPIIDRRSSLQRISALAQAVGNFGLAAATIYLISRD